MIRRWMIFCEAAADFRTAETLIDEVLRLRCSQWVRDLYEQNPEFVREWHGPREGLAWFDIHAIYAIARDLGVRLGYGHFNGRSAKAGARMLDTIVRIRRELLRRDGGDHGSDALVVVWDMDKQGDGRRAGLAQAGGDSVLPLDVTLVLGCPDPNREAWILAGFVPRDDELGQLEAARRELGFYPNERPHELPASDETALRNTKRVLHEALGVTTWEREQECLRIADDIAFQRLSARGSAAGLQAFLSAIEEKLVPQVDPAAVRRS